jgi:hypothetical protein
MARKTLSVSGFKTDKRLDIYIDSCSMQPEMLAAVDKMIEHVQTTKPQIYTSYRIIVPAMINIEANRVLFSELQDSVSFKEEYEERDRQAQRTIDDARFNRTFFEKHREHLVTSETQESATWKTLFIKSMPRVLNYHLEDYSEKIAQTATKIAEICNISMEDFTPEEVKTSIDSLYARIIATNARKPKANFNDEQRREVLEQISDATSSFHENLSQRERCIIQSCYFVGGFRTSIHNNDIFRNTMRDAGEGAIAQTIQALPDTEADKTTSLVISNDIGARRMLRSMDVVNEKAPIVITNDDFLKSVESSFAVARASQTSALGEDWQTRVTGKTTEDVAKFDHSSVTAFTQAIRTGSIDVTKIRAIDNTGHPGPAGA